MTENSILKIYTEAINKIDDYFEYRSESVKDRDFVYRVLSDLTEELEKINNDIQ